MSDVIKLDTIKKEPTIYKLEENTIFLNKNHIKKLIIIGTILGTILAILNINLT